ncbi:MAG: BrnT family toxin [Thermodesulfobacteriota bacterium]|jgi:hypothetical protein|nr:MAG: BrnT family toxin [Thermodesulfobacteriota bacterium]
MTIAWGPENAKLNFQKHKIRFSDAESVLFDPLALTQEDKDADGEQRFISIGTDAFNRVLVVVYAFRGDKIRIIPARRATKKERKCYEERI